MNGGHLQIFVCGAGPATDIGRLLKIARGKSWTTSITATASALGFIDVLAVEEIAGQPVRTSYQQPAAGFRVLPDVDAVVVAPATYNTINKLASGTADTYPLTSLAELIGRGVPTVVVPFVNAALAARAPFRLSLVSLRKEGVRIISGPGEGWEPHPPGTGGERQQLFPWQMAFDLAQELAERHTHR
ncbi:flavoprotein [Krasilnikovia cinnamomea]|uniref:Flavoprotein n=1 Tax=Krasilnikovia cinnamomea TaxID=349313 RepID=A0A4Q7ZUX2_9ACTN|nr:flavoprotein [Krasilnikovia cinnamomea]RZU54385.1 flavoprotein [Krasilnikovia cinnamomea]